MPIFSTFTLAADAPALPDNKLSRGWLRSPTFDLNLIFVVTLLAFGSGWVALCEPRLFKWVLLFDVWFLGYHHVVSTFTRLTFDSESFRQHRFLVLQLPIIVVVATVAAVMLFGYWVLPTAYLYWQWFHYTRQSYGIERMYRRKADSQAMIDDYATTRALYLLPLFGIVYRSFQQQSHFLGMPVKYMPVTGWLLAIVGSLAAVSVLYWTVRQINAWRQGRLAVAHTMYLLTHHAIFLTGYILIDDITTGWLVLNVWHNAQYILFVWWFNNNRFKEGVDQKHWFLSTISQTRYFLVYMAICLGISTLAYAALGSGTYKLGTASAVPMTLIVFMMINFHHYVVDGIIWKRRKPAAPQPA